MKKITISFLAGFVLILIGAVILLMGLGMYSDTQNAESFSWSLLGVTVFKYEAISRGGHLLHFGLGLLFIAIIGGCLNSSLAALLNKKLS